MRLRILLLGTVFVAANCAFGNEKKLVFILEQLRQCKFDDETPLVGGPAIGAAGTPHEFYLLFPSVSQLATDEDLVAMLSDKSPVVRIMAAKCILKQKAPAVAMRKAIALLQKDRAKVYVMPFGCLAQLQTVSEVLGELQRNPDFLGDLKEENSFRSEVRPSGSAGDGK